MKFYLSSFKLGNEIERLKSIIPDNKKTAYIANALDFADGETWQKDFIAEDIALLEKEVGLDVERFDLRNYFHNQPKLKHDLEHYGVIWVSGGNVFVLRQAMHLSGFDNVLPQLTKEDYRLYGGYSAGVCVLAPSLKGLELVDSITHKPYPENPEIIWEGLNILDYAIVPHYNSDHPESNAINEVVTYYEKNGISHKKIADGEVIIIV